MLLKKFGTIERIVREDPTRLIAFSGKMGSGKDSVAPAVLESLGIAPENQIHEFFANPLKREVGEILDRIRMEGLSHSAPTRRFMSDLALEQGVDIDDIRIILDMLWEDTVSGAMETNYTRTVGSRAAWQHWGTEVRRAQNESYWVEKAIASVGESLSEGKSVFVTDARFPNEVDSIVDIGGLVVRLNVGVKEQARRIKLRDNLDITPASLQHASETALDDYSRFSVVVNTDNFDIGGVIQEVSQQLSRLSPTA